MCPGAADANPVVVAAFAVADIVGEVAGVLEVAVLVSFESVMWSLLFRFSGCANRGLMAQSRKSLLAGAERTGQVGKLGATFRGNRFSDCADGQGLQT